MSIETIFALAVGYLILRLLVSTPIRRRSGSDGWSGVFFSLVRAENSLRKRVNDNMMQ